MVPYLSPQSEPSLDVHSRAAPSVEAHHRVNGPNNKKRRKANKKMGDVMGKGVTV